jgi:hypothetical protein
MFEFNLPDDNISLDYLDGICEEFTKERLVSILDYIHESNNENLDKLFPIEQFDEYFTISDFLCMNTLQYILVKNLLNEIIRKETPKLCDSLITKFQQIRHIISESNLQELLDQCLMNNNSLFTQLLTVYKYGKLISRDYYKNQYFDLFKINDCITYNPNDNVNLLPMINYSNNIVPKNQIIILESEFKDTLTEYTFNLLKYIPFESGNFIYSGGSLYDVLTHNYTSETINNYVDIDIFALNAAKKKETINHILQGLRQDGYECYVATKSAVVYIFIVGVPRLVQLIFTKQTSHDTIINDFDCSHVKSYYDGSKVYMAGDCIDGLMNGCSHLYEISNLNRIYKILHRGLSVSNCLLETCIVKKNNSHDYASLTEIDYNILLKQPSVINYIEKSKPWNVDLDTLCRLYEFTQEQVQHNPVNEETNNLEKKAIANSDEYGVKFSLKVPTWDMIEYTDKIFKSGKETYVNVASMNTSHYINLMPYSRMKLTGTIMDLVQIHHFPIFINLRIPKTKDNIKLMNNLDILAQRFITFADTCDKFPKQDKNKEFNIIKKYIDTRKEEEKDLENYYYLNISTVLPYNEMTNAVEKFKPGNEITINCKYGVQLSAIVTHTCNRTSKPLYQDINLKLSVKEMPNIVKLIDSDTKVNK